MNTGRTHFKKGIIPWNKGMIGVSTGMAKGTKFTEEHKAKLSAAKLGKKGALANNWQGGITPEGKRIRASVEYRLWREAVFARDNWTCQGCGVRGCLLNADHIKPFAYFPELRLAIDNGRTLCVSCHEKTDTYKGRAKSIYLLMKD